MLRTKCQKLKDILTVQHIIDAWDDLDEGLMKVAWHKCNIVPKAIQVETNWYIHKAFEEMEKLSGPSGDLSDIEIKSNISELTRMNPWSCEG